MMVDDNGYRLLTNQQLLAFVQRCLENQYLSEHDKARARDMVIELRRRHARRRDDPRVEGN